MLTIKVQTRKGDNPAEETVFEASQVRKAVDITTPGFPEQLYFDTESGQIIYDWTRAAGMAITVFVMNRFGATVAKYEN